MGWDGGSVGKVFSLQAWGTQFDPTERMVKNKTKTKQKPGVSWGDGSTDEAFDRQAGEPEFRSPESTQATYANTHLWPQTHSNVRGWDRDIPGRFRATSLAYAAVKKRSCLKHSGTTYLNFSAGVENIGGTLSRPELLISSRPMRDSVSKTTQTAPTEGHPCSECPDLHTKVFKSRSVSPLRSQG